MSRSSCFRHARRDASHTPPRPDMLPPSFLWVCSSSSSSHIASPDLAFSSRSVASDGAGASASLARGRGGSRSGAPASGDGGGGWPFGVLLAELAGTATVDDDEHAADDTSHQSRSRALARRAWRTARCCNRACVPRSAEPPAAAAAADGGERGGKTPPPRGLARASAPKRRASAAAKAALKAAGEAGAVSSEAAAKAATGVLEVEMEAVGEAAGGLGEEEASMTRRAACAYWRAAARCTALYPAFASRTRCCVSKTRCW